MLERRALARPASAPRATPPDARRRPKIVGPEEVPMAGRLRPGVRDHRPIDRQLRLRQGASRRGPVRGPDRPHRGGSTTRTTSSGSSTCGRRGNMPTGSTPSGIQPIIDEGPDSFPNRARSRPDARGDVRAVRHGALGLLAGVTRAGAAGSLGHACGDVVLPHGRPSAGVSPAGIASSAAWPRT